MYQRTDKAKQNNKAVQYKVQCLLNDDEVFHHVYAINTTDARLHITKKYKNEIVVSVYPLKHCKGDK